MGMVIINGPTGMGGQGNLLPFFLGIPMLVFVATFFCGHRVKAPVKTVWLDKLCIHQTRHNLKVKGVSGLPYVVANSNRMIILWSSTYFERLWCNAEVATFAATNSSGASNIDVLP